MTNTLDFGSAIGADSALAWLLSATVQIGGVYSFGFRQARVITNDAWTREAGGVPQHCFLLAYPAELRPGIQRSHDPNRTGDADRELVLLRVLAEAPLPNQADLERLRAEDADRQTTNSYQQRPSNAPTDPRTRQMMQTAAFQCQVLGTFTEDPRTGRLMFGKDVDTVYAASRYVVAKPYGASLQTIVDYVDNRAASDSHAGEPDATAETVTVGMLRYSSTRWRETDAHDAGRSTEVAIRVEPADFVAHKTAVFGMTRAGKSNTNKIIAASVYLHAKRHGLRIGQLVFDPAGEYAYANRQDGTALAQLGDDVRVYRLGATQADIARNIRPLSLNFLEDAHVPATWNLITTFFAHEEARYVTNYLSVDLSADYIDRDFDHNTKLAAARAFHFACLLNAGFASRRQSYPLPANQNTVNWLHGHPEIDGLQQQSTRLGWMVNLDATQLPNACQRIIEGIELYDRNAAPADPVTRGRNQLVLRPDNTTPWTQGDLQDALKHWLPRANGGRGVDGIDGLTAMFQAKGHQGWKLLRQLRPYHSADARIDYAESIYADLTLGRLVIVDLSRGSDQVLQTCAERIVNAIISKAAVRFRDGKAPRMIQIFIEEAHRLLDRDKFNKATEANDPYVRLARESAKYKIGLIYATQEVSAVDKSILSNTANWVCAYMNNAAEVSLVAKYYDFEQFATQIISADDPGFIRLRTASSPYTLPVQVRKFDLAMVNSVRAELGQPPVEASTDFAPGEAGTDDDVTDVIDPDTQYSPAATTPDGNGRRGRGADH